MMMMMENFFIRVRLHGSEVTNGLITKLENEARLSFPFGLLED